MNRYWSDGRATAVFIFALVFLTADSASSSQLPELRWLPTNVQAVIGFEWRADVDPATMSRLEELVLSLTGFGKEYQHFRNLTALKPGEQLERIVLARIPLSDGKTETVGIASGPRLHLQSPLAVSQDNSFSVLALGEHQLVFGSSAAVKLLRSRTSGASDKRLIQNKRLLSQIETIRAGSHSWGVLTRDWLGSEMSVSFGDEPWSFRGARSRLRSIRLAAQASTPLRFSMLTEAASKSDAGILADELREFLRQAGSGGVLELRPVANEAQLQQRELNVRLDLNLPAPAVKLLKGSRAAKSVLTWEIGALSRENRQRIPDIFQHLRLNKGNKIADVGAGGGFFTMRLARAVGTNGRIWAVDIVAETIKSLRKRIQDAHLDQVEVVLGEASNPKLPQGTLDAVLIVDSYHEMSHHTTVLEHLFRALRPEGRLVISEPFSHKRRDLPRAKQIEEHEIAPELVEQELRQAGFEVVFRDDAFIADRQSRIEWILVARRPG